MKSTQSSTQKTPEKSVLQILKHYISKILSIIFLPVYGLFRIIVPVFDPGIDLDQKLIKNETIKEHATIRHYSEVQIGLGLFLIPFGLVLLSLIGTPYLFVIPILGVLLFITGYEIEEIYVSSHRIFIRRIGMIERILKVPSDEDHSIEHLVSFNVGRAPANILLVSISALFYLIVFNDQIPEFVQLLVIIPATVILFYGLRIRRRAVTVYLAGGLSILMGIRKGVPKRIVTAIQSSMYTQIPDNLPQEDEIMAKELSD